MGQKVPLWFNNHDFGILWPTKFWYAIKQRNIANQYFELSEISIQILLIDTI